MPEVTPEIVAPEVTYPVYDNMPPGPGSLPPQLVKHHWQIRIDQVSPDERARRIVREPMSQILAGCSSYPPITHDESLELLEAARTGDKEARQNLILHFQRFVVYHAKYQYPMAKRLRVPMEDLVQDGMVGLVVAADKSDPEIARNTKGAIRSYVSWGIEKHMNRELAERSRLIHLPANVHSQARNLVVINSTLRAELGREPTDYEVAERAGWMPPKPPELIGTDEGEDYDEFTGRYPEYVVNHARRSHAVTREKAAKKVSQILAVERPWQSLDSKVPDRKGEFLPLHEVLADEDSERDMIDNAYQSVLRDRIGPAMDLLDDRHQLVLELRLGFDGEGVRTLEETGRVLNVTRERIRQMEINAYKKLQRSHLRPGENEELKVNRPAQMWSDHRTYIDHVGDIIEHQNRRKGRIGYWLEDEAKRVRQQEAQNIDQKVTRLLDEQAGVNREQAAANAKKNLEALAKDYISRCHDGSLHLHNNPYVEIDWIKRHRPRLQSPSLKVRRESERQQLREFGGLAAFMALSLKPKEMPPEQAWVIARYALFAVLRSDKLSPPYQSFVDIYCETAEKAFEFAAPSK